MEPKEGEQLIKCLRTDQLRTVEEHRGCPYCWGRVRDVATGERAQFCDYEPGKDPVAFGFPEGTSRENE